MSFNQFGEAHFGVKHQDTAGGFGATFEARLPKSWTTVLAFGWAAALSVVAWPAFLTNLESYRELGSLVYGATVAGLAALAAAVALHHWVRHWTARFEPAAFAAILLTACFWKEPTAAATILLFANSAFAIGRFAQRRLGLETDSPTADIGLCGALGLGALILAMMALGTAGLIGTEVDFVLLLAPCLLLRRTLAEFWRRAVQIQRSWRDFSAQDNWIASIAIVTLAVFAGFTLALTLTPTLSVDGLRYHLPSAVYYAETGSVAPLPGLRGSYLPQAIELLMTLTYTLAGLPAAQFVNPLFLVLCTPLIYALTRSCGFGRGAGVLAVVAGTCVPFVHWSGSAVKVDLAVPLFQLASLHCFIRGRRSKKVNWLLVGLLFLALSAGAKLTAIYGAIPLGLLHIYLFFQLVFAKVRFRFAQIAALVALVVVVAPFWQVRTYLAAGSPWYPMRTEALASRIPALIGERPGPIEAYLHYPWIVHFEGRMSLEGVSDNPAGVFLALFAPVWLFVRRRRANLAQRACLFFAFLTYLYWGFMWAFIRYAIPMFFIFYALTAGRVVELSRQSGRVLRTAITAGLIACLLFSVTVTARYEINMPQLLYLAGGLSKREFLLRANRFYASIEKLGRVARPGEQTLSVNNAAVLYAPDPVLFSYTYSLARTRAAKWARSRILKRLAEGEYRYLIIPTHVSESYLPAARRLRKLELIHEDAHFLLYRLSRS